LHATVAPIILPEIAEAVLLGVIAPDHLCAWRRILVSIEEDVAILRRLIRNAESLRAVTRGGCAQAAGADSTGVGANARGP